MRSLIVLFLLFGVALPDGRADELVSLDELAATACERSRVVMMNEAHSGMRRLSRTRQVGLSLLTAFHRGGVRALAMEALSPDLAAQLNRTRRLAEPRARIYDYTDQPDMRALMQGALDQGWTLLPYEADAREYHQRAWFRGEVTESVSHQEPWNRFRELNEAQHLVQHLRELPADCKMLVWCGNGHLSKQPLSLNLPGWSMKPYRLMGSYFQELSGIEPFCIDQTSTANWPGEGMRERGRALLDQFAPQLAGLPLHSGALMLDGSRGVDATIVSLNNDFEPE